MVETRNGVRVATKNASKKPVWEMTKVEQADEKTIVFDYDELLEFAEGDIGPVFGPTFNIIDTYKRRVRLPAREYLLVSRVTKMDAEPNVFRVGATMTTEYDLPINGELSLGGDIPWAILVESGQCDLMLISYMGIDFQCYGDRVYRLLDTTLTFYGVASEGETLVYDIKVNGFAKGARGEISMFFFEYNCYCNGKLLIEMRNGAAGFFTDEELAQGKGVLRTKAELVQRENLLKETKQNPNKIEKFMLCPCSNKTSFSEADMQLLVNKKWKDVMGEMYDLNYRLTTPKMLMIDRVTHLDPKGGIYGLGLIVGEKILERNHWYFPCHFVKDQVMAGSLVSDGCSQMLKLYMVWLGLHLAVEDAFQFRPVDGQPNKVRCRGQISPHKGKLVYVMEIREIGFDENKNPYAIADVDIIDINFEKGQSFDIADVESYGRGDLGKKIVVDFKGIALRIKGEPALPHDRKLRKNGNGKANGTKSSLVLETNKSIKGKSIPEHYLRGDSLAPSEVNWHPFYDLLKSYNSQGGKVVPLFSFYASSFPPRPISFTPFLKDRSAFEAFRNNPNLKVDLSKIFNEVDLNFTPGQLPLNFYNMCEFMCGKVSNCLGDEFDRFDISKTSRSPAFDLALVTRVIKVNNLVKKDTLGVDLDPGVGEMIAEFDCPSDAWFFDFFETKHVPYSIIMEIALQTSGILTSWLKAPLTMKMKDILFRNLDATAEMFESIRGIDFRGKTIINRSKCGGYNMLGKMGIHRFSFELFIKDKAENGNGNLDAYISNYEDIHLKDSKPFYSGETSFGWFVPEVFESQVGLDNGKKKTPYFMEKAVEASKIRLFKNINTPSGKAAFASSDKTKQSLLRKTAQSEFIDEVRVVVDDGSFSKGYAHGKKTVDTSDWFFSCHFWNDPVMPGSLGIESMFQLMEYYALETGLYKTIVSPMFVHCPGKTSWKYRGQLSTKNKQMDSEIHVKEIINKGEALEIVADGFLFVDGLRVYEAKDLRIEIVSNKSLKNVLSSTANAEDHGPLSNGKLTLVSGASNKLQLLNQKLNLDSDFSLREVSLEQLKEKLLDNSAPIRVKSEGEKVFEVITKDVYNSLVGEIVHDVDFKDLGDRTFMEFYGVKGNLYSGAMAKGIASADLVIAMGKSNLLGTLGAGGLPMHVVERNLLRIKEELKVDGTRCLPYSVNLIHSPFDPNLEEGNVALFAKHGVTISEASAFMNLTLPVIQYRVSGYKVNGKNVEIGNKLISKCSRTEVAEMFLRPPPEKMLLTLLKQNKITQEQYEVAKFIPMADDVTIEADSGGHTDNRQLHVILPLVINLRNKIYKELYDEHKKSGLKLSTDVLGKKIALRYPYRVRIGAGGGIGCPEAAACAFSLGAAFLVTGSINQLCRESGTCDTVRGYLAGASYSDVTMAPAADMFDQGVQLQVLKKGTMFPSRAKKLYDLFCKYNSFEEMPESEISALESRILKKTIAQVWEETKDFYINRLNNKEKIDRAEGGDTKLKMSLCFRWYLGLSSFWANSGDVDRKTDYQIWCGPAIGAFNDFIKGTYLDYEVSKVYPEVVQANLHILKGAAYLNRLNQIKFNPNLNIDTYDPELSTYKPNNRLTI